MLWSENIHQAIRLRQVHQPLALRIFSRVEEAIPWQMKHETQSDGYRFASGFGMALLSRQSFRNAQHSTARMRSLCEDVMLGKMGSLLGKMVQALIVLSPD